MSRGQYDRPETTDDGSAFENLVDELHLSMMGFDIGLHRDSERQIAIGESEQGVEIKWLKNSWDRLHIEIEHRTSTSSQWRTGGIYRKDNAKRYACGNNDDIWVFSIKDLIAWHVERKPREVWYGKDHNRHRMLDPERDDVRTLATIRSFVLDKTDALSFYRYRFIRQLDGGYKLLRRGFVGYDGRGHFVHYCHCGEWGNRSPRAYESKGELGVWFCAEHYPAEEKV